MTFLRKPKTTQTCLGDLDFDNLTTASATSDFLKSKFPSKLTLISPVDLMCPTR